MRRWTASAVAATALAAFLPALLGGFVSWDDAPYIVENPWIRGLSWENARWALTSIRGGFWQPLTWLSFQLDYSLWGLNPAGFHLTSLLLHAAACAAFYFVALELLGRERWKAAALAALFFAVHPLRVESVAWATERKGLLSGLFFLLSALAYLRGRPRAALAAFALSLAAKPMGLTLPFVLAIVETWRRRRLPDRTIWLGLAPFFVLSAASAVLTYALARGTGLAYDDAPWGAAWRVSRLLYGFTYYPLATLWPVELSPYNAPKAWFDSWSWQAAARALLLAAAGVACWHQRRARPGLAAVCAAYAIMLLPMSGVVQQGLAYAACDRFSYLPALGFALLFGAALEKRGGLALAWVALLGAASWSQCAVWRDSHTLWSTAVARSPGPVPLANLGGDLLKEGRIDEAMPYLERSLALEKSQPLIYENMGSALLAAGREDEARAVWRRGLAAAPSPELSALLGRSTSDPALLAAAVAARPARAGWIVDLGDALAARGRAREAAERYAAALSLEPGLGRARNNWGLLLARTGKKSEALAHYRAALSDPAARAQAHHNWGNLLPDAEAEGHYREALRLDPRLHQSQVNLGNIEARRGNLAAAAALYRAALETNPRSVEARSNLKAISP